MSDDWETPCPKRADKLHCTCWYDGDACCNCSDPALPEETRTARGFHPIFDKTEIEDGKPS